MAAKTYLEIVNKVLRRMREKQVTSVAENNYSLLIGELVNKSKKDIEFAWNWEELRVTFSVTTLAGTQKYYLTGLRSDYRNLNVWNDTLNFEVLRIDNPYSAQQFLLSAATTGPVQFYFQNGMNADEDVGFELYPIPDSEQTIRFDVLAPTADLVSDGDILYVPFQPVVELAVAYAKGERGEDGGATSLDEAVDAKRVLADWVATQAAQRPEEITWRTI
jgi:hypothetical protein